MAKVKEPNADLVKYAKRANDLHISYGQLTAMEYHERLKEEKAAAERIARRKGGGTGECKEISSAGQQTEQAD